MTGRLARPPGKPSTANYAKRGLYKDASHQETRSRKCASSSESYWGVIAVLAYPQNLLESKAGGACRYGDTVRAATLD